MSNERLEWVKGVPVDAGVLETIFVYAVPNQDENYDFYERSIWDVRYYPVEPTPELNARLEQELLRRKWDGIR